MDYRHADDRRIASGICPLCLVVVSVRTVRKATPTQLSPASARRTPLVGSGSSERVYHHSRPVPCDVKLAL